MSSRVDHSDPWKEDGNIVICAEEKYFRVHRSVLSDHSEVFKDMFKCPHHEEAEEKLVEGCPVVQLHDLFKDVQMVLKALYDRSYPLPHHKGGGAPLPHVTAFLRLGEKYDIPVLLEEAKAKLQCFDDPTAISTFERLKEAKPPAEPTKLFPRITDADTYNFQIMNLLHEAGLKAQLPLAMYHCVVYCPFIFAVGGYQSSNGTLHILSLANLRAYIRMRQVFENFKIQVALEMNRAHSCTRPLKCEVVIRDELAEKVVNAPPFRPWKSEWDVLLCNACSKYLKNKRAEAINGAWDKLPTAFNFRTWKGIKKNGDLAS